MFENRPAILLLLVAFAMLLVACRPPEQPEMRGSLYFGAGNYLAELDLRDGSTSVVANLGDVEIQEMSSQLDERLLLSVLAAHRHPGTGRVYQPADDGVDIRHVRRNASG